MYVCMYVCMYIYIYVYIVEGLDHVFIFLCKYAYLDVPLMYIYIYVYTYICIYVSCTFCKNTVASEYHVQPISPYIALKHVKYYPLQM